MKKKRPRFRQKVNLAHVPVDSTDCTVVYCDGGCNPNPGPGGYGAVIIANGSLSEISGFEKVTTNNRMELTAAIRSLHSIPSGRVVVYTDSRYVIDGITSWIKGWMKKGWKTQNKSPVLNRDLWEELHSHNIRLEVRWIWVKGHSGVTHNERADALADREIRKNAGGICTGSHFKILGA